MYQGVIFDIDGVLEYQGTAYPGAVETVAALRQRGVVLRFLTNSTLKSRVSAAEKLRRKGFSVEDGEVVTASSATALYVRENGLVPCWLLLAREGVDEFRDIPQDSENPAAVVVGDYRSGFNFETLNKALRLLKNGAKLVGMISERIDSSLGELELNVGAWAHMLEDASGVPAVYIGKPSRYVFDLTLEGMGLARDDVVIVGDRIHSDVAGAKAAEIHSILVRTGEFTPADLDSEFQPDYIFNSVADIMRLFEG